MYKNAAFNEQQRYEHVHEAEVQHERLHSAIGVETFKEREINRALSQVKESVDQDYCTEGNSQRAA